MLILRTGEILVESRRGTNFRLHSAEVVEGTAQSSIPTMIPRHRESSSELESAATKGRIEVEGWRQRKDTEQVLGEYGHNRTRKTQRAVTWFREGDLGSHRKA